VANVTDPIRNPPDLAAEQVSRSYYERRARMRDSGPWLKDRRSVLRNAIDEASKNSDTSMLMLRMAVECFAADMRDSGMAPETALLGLKDIVRDRRDIAGVLMREQISNWCIVEFFDPPNPEDLRVTPPSNGVQ
jgi:hypothetical protein